MRLGADEVEAAAYLADTGIARAVLDTFKPAQRERALEDVTALLAHRAGPMGVELEARILITSARTR